MRGVEYRRTSEINEQKSMSTIIGITGNPASGKDTVGDYLVSKGYTKITMSDILREEMTKLGIPTDRSSIHNYVTEMREKYGNGYLCQETIKRIKGNTVLSGLRNLEELKIFKERLGESFKLISVESPIETRYVRAKERGRIGDNISFERFKIEEEEEKNSHSGKFGVDLLIKQADFKIMNDGTISELFKKVDSILLALGVA